MTEPLDSAALDQIFRQGRSRNAWQPETVPDSTWRELYELVKLGPTSANCSPARFVFLTTEAAKRRLEPHLFEMNRAKTMGAPCVVVIGYDLAFYDKFDVLFPERAEMLKQRFSTPGLSERMAFQNGTLEGGYLIIAARALGFDTGPMGGFDSAGVDAEFFAGTQIKSNFVCSIGHGADQSFPRLPRLPFEDACQIL